MVGFLISMLLPYESFRPHIDMCMHYKSQNTSINEWHMYMCIYKPVLHIMTQKVCLFVLTGDRSLDPVWMSFLAAL